jgi:hypothetical protein
MNAPMVIAALLGAIVLVGGVRLWRQRRRPWWQQWLLQALQLVSAAMLYGALFPPERPVSPSELVVLTARADVLRSDRDLPTVALPEAPPNPDVERVPDLATALRRHPETTALRVIGAGLPMRDLDGARGLAVHFQPAPLRRGLSELYAPAVVAVGTRFAIHGRVEAIPGARVELVDPAAVRVAVVDVDAQGRFELGAFVRIPGRALYRLRVLDAAQQPVEELALPLNGTPPAALRVLVLDGGVSPEIKYLRRWSLDTGIDLRTQLSVRPGVRVLGNAAPLTPTLLGELDLVVLDERAFAALGEAGRSTLLQAVEGGLGVLLRVGGPLSASLQDEIKRLGFAAEAAEIAQTVTLADADAKAASGFAAMAAPTENASAPVQAKRSRASPLPQVSRRPLRVTSPDAVALVSDSHDEPLALWRARGRGRVALWWLGDSFRLVLAGDAAAHGSLWSHAFSTLARARAAAVPQLITTDARIGERQEICGMTGDGEIEAPNGSRVAIIRDPNAEQCAAWWPASAGWHRLVDGAGDVSWFVRTSDEAPGLAASARRAATLTMASAAVADTTAPVSNVPGSRWPWFYAWLAVSAGLWWLERRTTST